MLLLLKGKWQTWQMLLLLKRKWQTWLYLYLCLHMYLYLSLFLLGKAAAAFFLVSSFFQIRPDQAFGRRNDDAPSGGR